MKLLKCILLKLFAAVETMLLLISALIAPLLFFSVQWMFRTWNRLSMDELVFHLQSPLEGTNTEMVQEYLSECLAPALMVFLAVVIVAVVCSKKKWRYRYFSNGIVLAVLLLVAGGSIYTTVQKLDVDGYMESKGSYSEFIDTYYVDPANVAITFPEQKRNLIYIFLESMETTYADTASGGAFQENVIPELTEIAQENEDFSGESEELNGAYAATGATWTMAAMFAQTSGLPLNISIEDNSMDTQEHFFPGIITLGDILKEEGYSQTLLIGSDATFGGRRLYFTEHGNYDVVDHPYALQNGLLPAGYHVWWGYEDMHLFKFAKEKLEELSKQDTPFNLTMLTVDTHFEDGYICSECQDTYGDDQYSNVIACSDRQLGEFIRWIQRQDFYENTTIVLVGDHLTMDKDYCEDISEGYERKAYVAYINSPFEDSIDIAREYTTMEHFPTTLAALGVEIEGNRLGLGTNLFSSEQTLTERFGIQQVNRELKKNSKMMEEMADLDKDNKELMIREGRAPKASVIAGEYQRDQGLIPVSVTDIENVTNGIQSVQMAVWTKVDQSDLQWIPMEITGDGTYTANVNVMSYGFYEGEYQIHVYAVDGDGEQSILGAAVGIVD
jgi:hypothetical protein